MTHSDLSGETDKMTSEVSCRDDEVGMTATRSPARRLNCPNGVIRILVLATPPHVPKLTSASLISHAPLAPYPAARHRAVARRREFEEVVCRLLSLGPRQGRGTSSGSPA